MHGAGLLRAGVLRLELRTGSVSHPRVVQNCASRGRVWTFNQFSKGFKAFIRFQVQDPEK